MANAKPGVHVLQLKPISIPEALVRGEKALKWDEDTGTSFLCTIKVDARGHCLYWLGSRSEECSYIDIAYVRDTRTGKYARQPKDARMRDSCAAFLGRAPSEPGNIEDAVLNVCCASDVVNVTWHNFICLTEGCAKTWASEILMAAYNEMALNGSVMSFLDKTYTKLTLCSVDFDGKVPIKSIAKLLNLHRDDRKRLEKALDELGSGGWARTSKIDASSSVMASRLRFDDFFSVCMQLTRRVDVDAIFHDIGAKKKPYLTVEQFRDFLNDQQRDPRLNEILYPYASLQKAQELIHKYERNSSLASKGHMSQDAFLRFLLGDDNVVVPMEKYDLSDDMAQPLAHYFINSSHNTYLTGHQLKSPSSVEIYRQVLLSGCRCIELDIWNGSGADEEPVITHGYTLCTEVPFKDVVEAIAESAFKTSDYPVILSFENHCNTKQQAKMAAYCKQAFGDLLLATPLDGFPLDPGHLLPSPEHLKRRIIIKNKKKHVHRHHPNAQATTSIMSDASAVSNGEKLSVVGGSGSTASTDDSGVGTASEMANSVLSAGLVTSMRDSEAAAPAPAPPLSTSGQPAAANSDDLTSEDSDTDDESAPNEPGSDLKQDIAVSDSGTAAKEAEAGDELSSLVNYVTPVHFHSFEVSEKRNRSHEISSFVETQALLRLKEAPVEFVNYNKRQMSRIYPKGARIDSSNYMPQVFWNAGCQLVALNFQSMDLPMQLNLGMFEYNRHSGFILKPDFMRRKDRHFDPFSESTVDGIIAGMLSIKIISGQFLSDKKIGTYVEVEMYGLPADTVRRRRTKTVPLNGLCPVYDEKPFVFQKVILPTLAMIRIAVHEETGRFIGQRILPMESIRPGYRHISLRNEFNQPLVLQSLFVHIVVKDYVPDQYLDFANALANPIAYQSMLAKHAEQLAVLTDDFDSSADAIDAAVKPNNVVHQTASPPPAEEKPLKPTDAAASSAVSAQPAANAQPRQLSVNSNYTKKQQEISRTASVPAIPSVGVIVQKPSGVSGGGGGGGGGGGSGSPSSTLSRRGVPSRSLGNLAQALPRSETAAAPLLDSAAVQERFNAIDTLRGPTLEELQSKQSVLKVLSKKKKMLHKLTTAEIKRFCLLEKNQAAERERLARRCGATKATIKGTDKTAAARLQLTEPQVAEFVDVLQEQSAAIAERFGELFCRERELHLKHFGQYKAAVMVALNTSRSAQLKRLRRLHEEEERRTRRLLSTQLKSGMRDVGRSGETDKEEIARVKRELEQVFVKESVKALQWLQELVEHSTEEINRCHDDREGELEQHFAALEAHYSAECQRKTAEQERRLQQQVAADTDAVQSTSSIDCQSNGCSKSERAKRLAFYRATLTKLLQETRGSVVPQVEQNGNCSTIVPKEETKL